MPLPSVADWGPRADVAAQCVLTHTILIDGRLVEAQGNYAEQTVSTGFSSALQQQTELLIWKEAWPVMPNAANRVISPKLPGLVFQPIEVRSDDEGTHWIFQLKKVAA